MLAFYSSSHASSSTFFVEDFDFKRILWVFSGKKGVHAWISDPTVAKFDLFKRTSLINYLSLDLKKDLRTYPYHPALHSSLSNFTPLF